MSRDIPLICDIRQFYRELAERPLSAGAQALYMYLLYRLNEERQITPDGHWVTGISVLLPIDQICRTIQVSRNTCMAYIRELQEKKYIQYFAGIGRYESSFTILARLPKIPDKNEFSTVSTGGCDT